MLNRYLDLKFDVLHAATNNRYVDGIDIRLVNLGAIALFSTYKLTTSSGKQIENIHHAHIVCLLHKLIPSARGSDDLSIDFDRDRGRRRELTNNKNMKGKYHVRIYLKDVFGYAKQQEKGTHGLGYILTLTRKTDNVVLKKGNAINNGKIKINAIEWYIPHYIPSIQQQSIKIKQILSKTLTQLECPERFVFMKQVITQKFPTFELGT